MPKGRNKFEQDQIKRLERLGADFEYESEKLDYVIPGKYLTDIKIGDKLYVELKGYFRKEDRKKILAVLESNPDIDLRMVFQQDQYLHKESKQRRKRRKQGKNVRKREKYSDWCIKHGIQFAIGRIPEDWLDSQEEC